MNAIIAPLKWVYSLLVDQTLITIMGEEPVSGPTESLLVQDQGGHKGQLRFGVMTGSKGLVEITRVEVDYAAPLQLRDPGNRGFFETEGTLDPKRPFRIFWNGSATTHAGVVQMFVLIANFPDGNRPHQITITVHARRQHSPVGGFLSYGRTHRTVLQRSVELASEPLRGFALRPGWWATSPQPFLTEQALTVWGPGQSLTAHEIRKNGTVSSRHIKLPD